MLSDLSFGESRRKLPLSRPNCLALVALILFMVPLTVYRVLDTSRIPGLSSDIREPSSDPRRIFRKNCSYADDSTSPKGTFDVSQLPKDLRRGKLSCPKLIHRTWKDTNVPERWEEGVTSCKEKNPDFGYCHWTDAELEDLLATEYPWFLDAYHKYTYPIQRVDAARYFLLLRYGGVYLDLDYTCKVPLEVGLLNYANFDVVLAETVPTGVTNGFMTSVADHPFWKYVTQNLADSDRWYVVPYATVIFSTGPMYLTHRMDEYRSRGRPDQIGVIPKEVLAADILGHLVGNSWHRWDAKFALFFYGWRYVLIPLAVILALAIVVSTVCIVCRSRNKVSSKLKSHRSHSNNYRDLNKG